MNVQILGIYEDNLALLHIRPLRHIFQDIWSEIMSKTRRWMCFLLSHFFLF
jgi:hypothetical protein